MASTHVWIGAVVVLLFATLPFTFILMVPLCVIAFIIGFVGFIIKKEYTSKRYLSINTSKQVPSTGIPLIINDLRTKKQLCKPDQRMTGSVVIDSVLHEILDYIYRDYVSSWFTRLSDNEAEFKVHVRESLQHMVVTMSDRIKDVDLIKFLSEDLVDTFTTHIQIYRQALEKTKQDNGDPSVNMSELEQCFFQLEETSSKQNLCRSEICLNADNEKEYTQVLSEVLLYLLLPESDFNNKSLRFLLKEVMAKSVILPFVDMLSQPDYINETLLVHLGDTPISSELLQVVVKCSPDIDELKAVLCSIDQDIMKRRGRDSGGDVDAGEVKRTLASLYYMKQLCEKRISNLENDKVDGEVIEAVTIDIDDEKYQQRKSYNLPFDVTMQNNTAISFFLEFLTNIGAQAYIFFYLSVSGYRTSTKSQLNSPILDESDIEIIREAAINIYNEYIKDRDGSCIEIDYTTLKQLRKSIYNGRPSATVFDEVQQMVSNVLKYDPRFYSSFRQSMGYIQMLTHLDLPREGADLDRLGDDDSRMKRSADSSDNIFASSSQLAPNSTGDSMLSAHITNTGTCQEFGQTYTVYFISVKRNKGDYTESWDIYRRYSDFYDLHRDIMNKYPTLGGLILPAKKTFNNMNKDFLEKRSEGLHTYLQTLLSNRVLKCHSGLERIVLAFLDNVALGRDKNSVSRKIVNPLKASVANVGHMVKCMPDNVIGGVARVSEGILSLPNSMLDGVGRILQNKTGMSRSSSASDEALLTKGSFLENEIDNDNLPLRILLQMMDEIFDLKLKTRGDWLYKKIADIIRGIIKKFYGDNLNKKIVDNIMWMTSADQVAVYLNTFRHSFWPKGTLTPPREPRDKNTKMRTRVVCKAKLINAITEELRTLMGSEVTRKGALRVFTMLQAQRLNKRLIYITIEGILKTLFPAHKFDALFEHMHRKKKNRQNKA